VEEILAVAAWCISLFAVHYLHEPLTQLLTPYLENETGGGVLAFVLLLIVPYGITASSRAASEAPAANSCWGRSTGCSASVSAR
jgi:membrane protein required for colicin V production